MSVGRGTLLKLDWSKLPWRHMDCARSELRLDLVLRCGQSFRWSRRRSADEWQGALAGKVWLLKQDERRVQYKCFPNSSNSDEDVLKDYFQLDVSRKGCCWLELLGF